MATSSLPQTTTYHHHHALRHKLQPLPTPEPALLEQEVVDKLLVDCVRTICQEQAHKQQISQPIIESVALESLVAAAEEFIFRLLSRARQSMLAARRVTPIATDFETAFAILNVPRPDDELRSYKTDVPPNRPLLPTPPPEDEFHSVVEPPAAFLGPELDGNGGLKKFSFSTAGLPKLPSAHTYKHTAVYPYHESDMRKIRELATHEGKLGEQALRKLAGAVKIGATHPVDTERSRPKARPRQRKRWKSGVDISEEAVFQETLQELLAKEPGGFELGPIVTCEKAYRMPDDSQVKRRAAVDGSSSGGRARPGASDTIEL